MKTIIILLITSCFAVTAFAHANDNDIILVAGKGHETYQIIDKQKIDFSDKAVTQEALIKRI